MTFRERMLLLFNKNKVIKVVLFHKDKRVTSHIVKPEDAMFKIGDRQFTIEPEKVFYDKGLPTIIYNSEDPTAGDPMKWESQSAISSREFYDAMEEKVSRDIIRYASEGDDKLQNTLLMGAGIVIVAMAIGFYFLFGEIQTMAETLQEYQPVLDGIKDRVIEGGIE